MLIDKTEIAKHREIARGVRDDKINPFIEDAELLDIKPLLGNALYFDLVKNLTDTKYVELLDGKEFDVNGITHKFTGLKKILSIFSDARYKLFGSYTDTAFGLVEKNHNDSTQVSHESKKNIYSKNRQIAYQYFEDVKLFLNNNKETYSLWMVDCNTRQTSSFRISKIS